MSAIRPPTTSYRSRRRPAAQKGEKKRHREPRVRLSTWARISHRSRKWRRAWTSKLQSLNRTMTLYQGFKNLPRWEIWPDPRLWVRSTVRWKAPESIRTAYLCQRKVAWLSSLDRNSSPRRFHRLTRVYVELWSILKSWPAPTLKWYSFRERRSTSSSSNSSPSTSRWQPFDVTISASLAKTKLWAKKRSRCKKNLIPSKLCIFAMKKRKKTLGGNSLKISHSTRKRSRTLRHVFVALLKRWAGRTTLMPIFSRKWRLRQVLDFRKMNNRRLTRASLPWRTWKRSIWQKSPLRLMTKVSQPQRGERAS